MLLASLTLIREFLWYQDFNRYRSNETKMNHMNEASSFLHKKNQLRNYFRIVCLFFRMSKQHNIAPVYVNNRNAAIFWWNVCNYGISTISIIHVNNQHWPEGHFDANNVHCEDMIDHVLWNRNSQLGSELHTHKALLAVFVCNIWGQNFMCK